MTITIDQRYMTLEQLRARHGIPIIHCTDAFYKKDILKEMGYQFNSIKKSWEIVIDPAHFMDLCGETAIACKLSPVELESFVTSISEFLESSSGAGYNAEFTAAGLDERYNAYCDSIGF